ncbi:hypothetical protein [Actinosynnema sp. NPDC020468]|uniref:hypothetical protein n=1 Tax=Actinosynnema sp. NPDC020468 TaxID=3154488 RepID=UPI0034070C86
MRTTPPAMPPGFAFALGAVLGVLATTAAVTLGATTRPVLSLALLVAVVDTVAALSTTRATLATAAVCWALHAGFVLGRHGDLALTPDSARHASVILLCSLAGLVVAHLLRLVNRGVAWRPAHRLQRTVGLR